MKNLFFFLILFISSEILSQTYQPENFLIEDPPNQYDQHETAIAIDPNDPDHIMVTWNDFREGEIGADPGYAFSTDGGINWTTGLLETPDYFKGADPSCGFDKNGYAYYTYVASDGYGGKIFIQRTTDNGPPWDTSSVSQSDYTDKPYMAIDNTGSDYDGRIYVTWYEYTERSTGIMFAYSADQGENFEGYFELNYSDGYPGPGAFMGPIDYGVEPETGFVQSPVPAIAPNGDIYVVWLVSEGEAGSPGTIKIRKNTNGGGPDNWGDIITIADITVAWRNFVGALSGSSSPTIAITPSGYIYVAFTQLIDDDLDIYYVFYDGETWSEPVVATESTTNYQLFPWLSVSPSGIVSLVYHQGTSSAIDIYVTEIYPGETSFHHPDTRITSESSNPNNVANSLFQCDYIGVASTTGNKVYTVWGDFRATEPYNADIYIGFYDSKLNLAHENSSLNNDATAHNNNHIMERGYFGHLHETFYSGGEIFYRRSSNNGTSWETTKLISSSNDNNNHPSIAINIYDEVETMSDMLLLVWQRELDNYNYEIWYSYSINSGDSWSSPAIVPGCSTVTVSYYQSKLGSGAGPTPVVGSYMLNSQIPSFLLVYADEEGLRYRYANYYSCIWTIPQNDIVPGSDLSSVVCFHSLASYSNQGSTVNLIYDERFSHVYSQIYNSNNTWTNRVVVDWVGSYNRTSSIAVDYANNTLGVWIGWNGDNFVTRFRQGYANGTWSHWCKEWSAAQDGINFLYPSITYYKKDSPNPYGIDILWNTSAQEIRQKTYSGLGDTWIPADPNTQLIATSGLFANLTHERENTTKPIQIWTDQSEQPHSILYNSDYLPKENLISESEIRRAAEITNDSNLPSGNSHLRIDLSEPVITLTNGEEIKIPFKSYDYSDTLELSTENVFDYLQTELVNIPSNAQSVTFKVDINASQPDTLSDGTLNTNPQTPFRTINFGLLAKDDSSNILLNNIGNRLLNNLSGLHHYSREFTVSALALRGRNIRTLPNINLSGTFNHNNLHFTLVNISIEGAGIGKDLAEDENNKLTTTEFSLEQNYPNPFNPITQIRYSIVEDGLVTLKVYDILGKEVAILVSEEKPAGNYEVKFNAPNLSSGIYFYTLTSGNFTVTKKLILLK